MFVLCIMSAYAFRHIELKHGRVVGCRVGSEVQGLLFEASPSKVKGHQEVKFEVALQMPYISTKFGQEPLTKV